MSMKFTRPILINALLFLLAICLQGCGGRVKDGHD